MQEDKIEDIREENNKRFRGSLDILAFARLSEKRKLVCGAARASSNDSTNSEEVPSKHAMILASRYETFHIWGKGMTAAVTAGGSDSDI